jgi:hypothetical protein
VASAGAGQLPGRILPTSMLTSVTAGQLTIRGISVGGVYTSLCVPELGLVSSGNNRRIRQRSD